MQMMRYIEFHYTDLVAVTLIPKKNKNFETLRVSAGSIMHTRVFAFFQQLQQFSKRLHMIIYIMTITPICSSNGGKSLK